MLSVSGEIPYWIVQNSWGTTWGDKGYVYIKIGGNVCGKYDLSPQRSSLYISFYIFFLPALYVAVPASPLWICNPPPSLSRHCRFGGSSFPLKRFCVFFVSVMGCLCEWLCVVSLDPLLNNLVFLPLFVTLNHAFIEKSAGHMANKPNKWLCALMNVWSEVSSGLARHSEIQGTRTNVLYKKKMWILLNTWRRYIFWAHYLTYTAITPIIA